MGRDLLNDDHADFAVAVLFVNGPPLPRKTNGALTGSIAF
jgi:hypothetical protein